MPLGPVTEAFVDTSLIAPPTSIQTRSGTSPAKSSARAVETDAAPVSTTAAATANRYRRAWLCDIGLPLFKDPRMLHRFRD
jgi:hypothetical protein